MQPPVQVTPRQRQILEAISASQRSQACSPTMAELARALGLSRSTVFEHLDALRSSGLLTTSPGRARSSRLTDRAHALLEQHPASAGVPVETTALPLVGDVAAGLPIEAVERHDCLTWSGLFGSGGDLMALRVRGDSMIGEGIQPGDYVVCRRQPTARDGDLVVARIDGDEATLKRLHREGGRARLEAANPHYPPLFVRDCRVEGVVVGLVRAL